MATALRCSRMGEGTKFGVFGHAATEDGDSFLWISVCGSRSRRRNEAQDQVRSQSDDAEDQMAHQFGTPDCPVWPSSSKPQSPIISNSAAPGSDRNDAAMPGSDPGAASALKAKPCRRNRRRLTLAGKSRHVPVFTPLLSIRAARGKIIQRSLSSYAKPAEKLRPEGCIYGLLPEPSMSGRHTTRQYRAGNLTRPRQRL